MKREIIVLLASALMTACSSTDNKWDATGTFEATEITVSAEGNGKIIHLALAEGDSVTANTTVGIIDTTQLYLKKLQILASRESAISRRSDLNKQIAATQQQIKWQKGELKRFNKLLTLQAATQKQIDDISNQIAVLEMQLSAQRSTIESTNQSIDNDSHSLDIQAALVSDQLLKCHIQSPINGRVLTRYAEEGEYTAPGKPLFVVSDLSTLYLRAYITADQLSTVKLNQPVTIYCDYKTKEKKSYKGNIVWIASQGEFTPKTIQTRDERANQVYAIKIAVPNDGYLRIGMYGEIKF